MIRSLAAAIAVLAGLLSGLFAYCLVSLATAELRPSLVPEPRPIARPGPVQLIPPYRLPNYQPPRHAS